MTLRTDDLVIPQGATWEVRWPIVGEDGAPADLSGWEARAQARSTIPSPAVLHEFDTAVVDSSVALKLTPAESSAFVWTKAVYDVELFHPDGRVVRVTQGAIRIDPEVTR